MIEIDGIYCDFYHLVSNKFKKFEYFSAVITSLKTNQKVNSMIIFLMIFKLVFHIGETNQNEN